MERPKYGKNNTPTCEFEERCQYSHNKFWQRRCPYYISDQSSLRYIPVICRDITVTEEDKILRNDCTQGGSCPFAHTHEEVNYHPLAYKTVNCEFFQKGGCKTFYCPFVHGLAERRTKKTFYFPFAATDDGKPVPHYPNVILKERRVRHQTGGGSQNEYASSGSGWGDGKSGRGGDRMSKDNAWSSEADDRSPFSAMDSERGGHHGGESGGFGRILCARTSDLSAESYTGLCRHTHDEAEVGGGGSLSRRQQRESREKQPSSMPQQGRLRKPSPPWASGGADALSSASPPPGFDPVSVTSPEVAEALGAVQSLSLGRDSKTPSVRYSEADRHSAFLFRGSTSSAAAGAAGAGVGSASGNANRRGSARSQQKQQQSADGGSGGGGPLQLPPLYSEEAEEDGDGRGDSEYEAEGPNFPPPPLPPASHKHKKDLKGKKTRRPNEDSNSTGKPRGVVTVQAQHQQPQPVSVVRQEFDPRVVLRNEPLESFGGRLLSLRSGDGVVVMRKESRGWMYGKSFGWFADWALRSLPPSGGSSVSSEDAPSDSDAEREAEGLNDHDEEEDHEGCGCSHSSCHGHEDSRERGKVSERVSSKNGQKITNTTVGVVGVGGAPPKTKSKNLLRREKEKGSEGDANGVEKDGGPLPSLQEVLSGLQRLKAHMCNADPDRNFWRRLSREEQSVLRQEMNDITYIANNLHLAELGSSATNFEALTQPPSGGPQQSVHIPGLPSLPYSDQSTGVGTHGFGGRTDDEHRVPSFGMERFSMGFGMSSEMDGGHGTLDHGGERSAERTKILSGGEEQGGGLGGMFGGFGGNTFVRESERLPLGGSSGLSVTSPPLAPLLPDDPAIAIDLSWFCNGGGSSSGM
uniref:C3H1-type domain-containing protein n=1 Tax=Chromera velia CCMP2878 TaxID=1169474 RepID=A0A0G4HRF8_9ALVE|eukprot:Cvel_8080.t1-p1 / transcript=Cvel_8080.t1 / gene=Cvel_8080 / organism=Chromera_velia_CCMP2878 / gene_product=hypothetical protein / transcript_product=hypothetical protein / location=Cvel_scaffold438:34307-39934(-) / protein_length=860 / sequence_SO=supercontig / SO=protein_coding / is_pseudo=false